MSPNNKDVRRRRGSVPPAYSLEEALTIAGQIYEQGGGEVSQDMISRITGHSRSSSALLKKISALKAFGLVVDSDDGISLKLTDVGLAIVAPKDPVAKGVSTKAAFLSIDIFGKIYERHKGKLLPADEFLKNIVEQDCNIPRDLSDQWVTAFKEGLRTAALSFDRGDGKVQILETPIVRFSRLPPTAPSDNERGPERESPQSDSPSKSQQQPTERSQTAASAPEVDGHQTRMKLSDGRIAAFWIPDHISAKDANKLKSALKGIESIIDSMVSEEINGGRPSGDGSRLINGES